MCLVGHTCELAVSSDEGIGGCSPPLSHQVTPPGPCTSATTDATSGAHLCPLLCAKGRMTLREFTVYIRKEKARNKVIDFMRVTSLELCKNDLGYLLFFLFLLFQKWSGFKWYTYSS